ncbi:MAG: YvcK family protein, partial [Oscillospiraceae bacterium]|nr:YvcK family protein [Oscillospiraceae bacterium]
MNNVVVFGGGTGLSCLLSGLKLFPVDVTTVITVSDNGSSTGVLKKELEIPAVGDIGKVLISMANVDEDFVRLLRYRFSKDGSLKNHPVRNIMLAALIDLKGNLTEATRYMCRLLNVKGTVLPLTEEVVELVGESKDHLQDFFGEEEVSQNIRNITKLSYDHDVHASEEIVSKILES